jgi:predicted DCC family thiol-disulfide oxidoreductase YuxK
LTPSSLSETEIVQHPVLLFDGVCNLCSGYVQWVIKHDKDSIFRMASLQSEIGQRLVTESGLDIPSLSSLVVIDETGAFTKSTAVLKMLIRLRVMSWFAVPALWVPRFIRDLVYGVIAKNRYRLFGKQEACFMPTPELRARFLDWGESAGSS